MTTKPPVKPKKPLAKIVKESPENIFQFVQDVTDKLTLTRLSLVVLAAIITTFCMFFYENRNMLFDAAIRTLSSSSQVTAWDVSKESKIEIIKLVRDSALINMISVSQIDLQKNKRTIRYWELQSSHEQEVRNKFVLSTVPVFDDDGRNTSQILAVLNGDFICSAFNESHYAKTFPELIEEIPIICRISIPPVYGHSTGILTIGLTKKPTADEMTSLKQDAFELANRIYVRDIIKKSIG